MKKIILFLAILGSISLCSNAQNRPAKIYRDGKIQIAVWIDTIQQPDTLIIKKNYKVCRNYKKNGKWINSSYFNEDELIRLRKLLDEAIKENNLYLKK